MDTNDLLHRHCKQTKGIVIPDVSFGGIGDVLDVGECLDLVRRHACLGQTIVVERHIVHTVLYLMPELLKLQRLEFLTGHGLNVLLKKHGFTFFPLFSSPFCMKARSGFCAICQNF